MKIKKRTTTHKEYSLTYEELKKVINIPEDEKIYNITDYWLPIPTLKHKLKIETQISIEKEINEK